MSGRRDGGLARRQPGEKGLGWAGLLGWVVMVVRRWGGVDGMCVWAGGGRGD